ncbi:MAG: PAS domain-containing protein [Acidobacteria bacterium]|nr:PAS domain-containing protein [Acidobacteriota bacterium]
MEQAKIRDAVLVVDDEPQILTSLQLLLEDEFAVTATSDPEAGLQFLRQGHVSVILSDQRMPGLSGDKFLAAAGQLSPATRILITGYTDLDALVQAVNHGQIYSYIAKPWDPMELRITVAKAAEYYRLQQELARERDLLHTLMANIPDAIFFKDTECRYQRLNQPLARILGPRNLEEAVGKRVTDFRTDETGRVAMADDRRVLETGEMLIDREEQIRLPDGRLRWFSTTKAPIREAGRITGLVGISRDITERKQAEEVLVHHSEALAHYNAELEQFAYVAAHDLQEPLRTVASFSQLLAQRYAGQLDAQADRFIEQVVSGARRMRQLIDDLLMYSRLARGESHLQPTDTADVFRASLESLQAAVAESGAMVTADPLPTVTVDPTQVGQLFQNLLSNAIKFRGPDPPRIHFSAERKGAEWVFSLRDNGIGIDPQYCERIFKVFQRLHGKREYPGTGIGLAACKRIVERHGGRIWVESEAGRGSTFYFTIPA